MNTSERCIADNVPRRGPRPSLPPASGKTGWAHRVSEYSALLPTPLSAEGLSNAMIFPPAYGHLSQSASASSM
jgi:hypothetical protein